MSGTAMPLDAITVNGRHRSDMGDINALARNIAEVGLLHPVVVTPEGKLIAGQRRLEAVRLLGWAEVPVSVVPLDDLIKGEWSENAMRKDFTPSEAVAIGRALEDHEREKAKARMTLGKIYTGSDGGRTRDIIGAAVGMSGPTYEAAKSVVKAAEQDPETYGKFAEEMDQTRKVHTAYEHLQRARKGIPQTKASTTATATIERHETIKKMAQERYSPAAIADHVGIGEYRVRGLLKRWNIETVDARIGKTGRRLEATRIMDAVCSNAGPTEETVAVLMASWDDLDETRFAEWEGSLSSAIQLLTRIRNRLRKDGS